MKDNCGGKTLDWCVVSLLLSQGSFGGARVFLNLEQNTRREQGRSAEEHWRADWRAPRLPGQSGSEKQETGQRVSR